MSTNRSRLRAAIFDRNHVLLDFDTEIIQGYLGSMLPLSLQELAYQWNQWADRVGYPATHKQEKNFWRGFWNNICDELALNDSIRDELLRFDYLNTLRAYPDVRPALETVKQAGLKVGVLSNFSLTTLDASLDAVGLGDLVDEACGAMVIGVAKPASEAYLYMTDALDVQPEECLFFDNKPPYIDGARALGMRAYQVDRGRSQHDLNHHIVCDLTAVPLIIQKEMR